MRPDALSGPLSIRSRFPPWAWLERLGSAASRLWYRWCHWERRFDVIWYAAIGLLLLLYLWLLFTGTVSRRH